VLYYESLQGQIRVAYFDARRLADSHFAIVSRFFHASSVDARLRVNISIRYFA